jgi:hypothetical protein
MAVVTRLLGHLAAATSILSYGLARAASVSVPDDYSSVQAAIDSGADTVLVREGTYAEAPLLWRPVTLQGLGARRPSLAGLGISNPYHWPSKRWSISGLEILGRVLITTAWPGPRGLTIDFVRCKLDSGFTHHSGDPDDLYLLNVTDCYIGAASYARAYVVSMRSDTLDSGIAIGADEFLTVEKCWFKGGPEVALDVEGNYLSGVVQQCIFESYRTALRATDVVGFNVASNIIRKMSGFGIICVASEQSELRSNLLEDCEAGLLSRVSNLACYDNTLLGMNGTGMLFDSAENLRLERNTIGNCGGAAIVVRGGGSRKKLRIYENTLYNNSASGIVLEPLIGDRDTIWVQGNIISGNSGWGLRPRNPQEVVVLGCNDWYGNGLGAVEGGSAAPDDFSVDPGFCDMANDDVTLFSDSPLIGRALCGRIGARGVGCIAPTLRVLNVVSNKDGLRVAWDFSATSVVESWLERAEHGGGPWDSLGTGNPTGENRFEMLDRAVAPDRGYHYRVAWRDRGSVERGAPVVGTWFVEALSGLSPNPAVGRVQVEWVLAQRGTTDIRVFDLAGREVSVVARGSFDVGRHQASWNGRWEGRGLAPPGMYIVRFSNNGRATSHRVLLLR